MPSDPILEIGEAHLGIELKRTCNEPPRVLQTTDAGVTRSGHTVGAQERWVFPAHLFRQLPSLIMPAGVEMSDCCEVLHEDHQRIERAEPHSARQVLDPRVRIAKTGSQQAAGAPSGCQVRVQHKRAIDQRGTFFKLAGNIAKRKPAKRQRDRILPNSAALRASRATSAFSCARLLIQLFTMRQ